MMTRQRPALTHGIGVMSGTSLDGLDLAHCRFHEDAEWELLEVETVPLSNEWKKRLAGLTESSAVEFARTDIEMGHFIGEQVSCFLQKHQLSPDFVASHGHTIFHQPGKKFTSQIGDGETLAGHLNCPVVTNFRNKDVALGGQGAPLVPGAERALFPKTNLFLNLGGIANLSIGDLAWDVCACNMTLNWLANLADPTTEYDPDGRMAAQGKVSRQLLAELESLDWYQTPPPRSLGAEWFQEVLTPILEGSSLPINDRLATYCHHVARQIRDALQSQQATGVGEILITGGGAHNNHLISELTREMALIDISVAKGVKRDLIDFKEALCFAWLGRLTLLGKTNTLPSVTGAKLAAVSGSIHLPSEGGFQLVASSSET